MDSLQFQKAEFADSRPVCAGCKNRIDGSFYRYGGREICESCSEHIRMAGMQPPAATSLARPLLFGLGAAIGCSLAYAAVTAVSGIQIGLLSILVGYLIARAIRLGSNGAGGRPYQIMAVVLTYLAITLSDVPLILRGVTVPWAQVWPQVTSYALLSPFTTLSEGVSSILGLIILGMGILQAWRLTAGRQVLALTGPYRPDQGGAVV